MATNTYVALATANGTGSSPVISFTGIPATYTDLVLTGSYSATAGAGFDVTLNNVTTNTSYSVTRLTFSGASVVSYRSTNQNMWSLNYNGSIASTPNTSAIEMNFFNYTSTTTYKTMLAKFGNTTTDVGPVVGLWRGSTGSATEAINRIDLTAAGGANWATNTTFSLYGILREGTTPAAKATGGVIYSDTLYYYHVFGSTGVFTPLQSLTCDYLVVAGGGGGSAGGGGAGGLRSTVGTTGGGGSLESALSLNAQAYTITVGAGGAGGGADAGTGGNGTNGGNSSIAGSGLTTVTSTGGGGGAKDGGGATAISANNGGSGGGLGWNNLTGSVGIGTANQGYNGGGFVASGSYAAGGGGGAGNAGQTAPSGTQAGAGGTGVLITGFATATGTGVNSYYAGGGGAGIALTGGTGGAAGAGGGGTGGNGGTGGTGGTNAVANTGGGGGGRTNQGAPTAYNGGSGLVIVRYLKA
jgi:hypothetical protein